MKASFVVLHVIACVFFLVGIGMLQSATSLPVYTDPGAPETLSRTLEDLPRDQRFKKWYQELPKFETAHKRLTDQGRGLMALGIGISCGALFLQLLKKSGENRGGLLIGVYWTLLWAVKFPLTLWYYSVRQSRFDYPVWGGFHRDRNFSGLHCMGSGVLCFHDSSACSNEATQVSSCDFAL